MSISTAPGKSPERQLTAAGVPQLRLVRPEDDPPISGLNQSPDGVLLPMSSAPHVTVPMTVERPDGQRRPLNFILDTGSNDTVLSVEALRTIGIDASLLERSGSRKHLQTAAGVRSVDFVRLTLRVSGLEEYPLSVVCAVLDSTYPGSPLFGLRDLVRHFDLSITQTAVTLTPRGAGEAELPVVRAKRILSGDLRSSDYLEVPGDVIPFIDQSESRATVQVAPEPRQRMISELALQTRYAGEEVLVRYTPAGVVVLAAGSPAVDALLAALTPEQSALLNVVYPPALA